jgi:hypothetical protein
MTRKWWIIITYKYAAYFILSSFLNSMFDFNRSKFNDVKTQSLKKLKREINFLNLFQKF